MLVVAAVMLLGLWPAGMAVRMIRRRRLALSRDGPRVIEGRPAVVTGSVVLVLMGVCYLLFSYALVQAWWNFNFSRRVELAVAVLAAALIYGGLCLGLVSAVVWRIRRRRMDRDKS